MLKLNEFKELDEILKILENKSIKSIVIWFSSVNSWLGGKTPAEMWRTDPEAVLYAAMVEVTPIMRG